MISIIQLWWLAVTAHPAPQPGVHPLAEGREQRPYLLLTARSAIVN